MENSLLVIFGEIWPMTLYYSTWSLARFLSNFKNHLMHTKSSPLLHISMSCFDTFSTSTFIKDAIFLLAFFAKSEAPLPSSASTEGRTLK